MKLIYQIPVLLLSSLCSATLLRSDPSLPYYVGAVVEYRPELRSNSEKKVTDINADNYVKFVEKAIDYAVDIIVFPESSLSISTSNDPIVSRSEAASYIPDPNENVVPCDDETNKYSYSLKTLSCAAKNHTMYIVINHREKFDCDLENCPSDGLLIYNTNVAFDRNGKVIARYRKYNLFGEYGTNITDEPIPSTFETDFGVTFGQFICFDILFAKPTLTLVKSLNVTDIIFPSHWFSELPFLYSVEAQAAWSHANDVNVLSSGYNNPDTCSGGSGIFMGKSGYDHVILGKISSNILLVSKVPKVINGKRSSIDKENHHIYKFSTSEINTTLVDDPENYKYLKDYLEPYTTELLEPKSSTLFEKTLCHEDHCCNFNLQMNFDETILKDNTFYYRYRIAIFRGTRSFSGVTIAGVKTCGIISCINDNIAGCGVLFNSSQTVINPTTFVSIEIKTKLNSNEETFIMPVTFTQSMLPLNATDFSYKKSSEHEEIRYEMDLKKPINDLLTFALYGRYFPDDEVTKGSSNTNFNTPVTLLISTLLFIFIIRSTTLKLVNKL